MRTAFPAFILSAFVLAACGSETPEGLGPAFSPVEKGLPDTIVAGRYDGAKAPKAPNLPTDPATVSYIQNVIDSASGRGKDVAIYEFLFSRAAYDQQILYCSPHYDHDKAYPNTYERDLFPMAMYALEYRDNWESKGSDAVKLEASRLYYEACQASCDPASWKGGGFDPCYSYERFARREGVKYEPEN